MRLSGKTGTDRKFRERLCSDAHIQLDSPTACAIKGETCRLRKDSDYELPDSTSRGRVEEPGAPRGAGRATPQGEPVAGTASAYGYGEPAPTDHPARALRLREPPDTSPRSMCPMRRRRAMPDSHPKILLTCGSTPGARESHDGGVREYALEGVPRV
jgi:hypothetical protein